MSTYFYGCCHNCKVFIEASNSSTEIAEEITRFWAYLHGHKGHDIQTESEYADDFFDVIKHSSYYDVTHERDTLFEREYSFEEVKRIHFENGTPHAFNESLRGRSFHLEVVGLGEIPLHSTNNLETFRSLPWNPDTRVTEELLSAIERGDTLPPVILLQIPDGAYDLKDGMHRVVARKELEKDFCLAFVASSEKK